MTSDQTIRMLLTTASVCLFSNLRGPIRAFLERKGILKPRVKRPPSPRWITFGNWLGRIMRTLLRSAK